MLEGAARGALFSAAAAVSLGGEAAPAPAARLAAETRTIVVNGRSAKVFRLRGPDGKPGIRLAPGARFRVDLVNETIVPTIVHWHGELPPWTQDGFPWPQTPPLAPGAIHGYDFAPIPGTYWMHSHLGLQEQSLMTAPLIVPTAAERDEDRQEVVLMLNDFSFRAPDELLAGLTGQSPALHAMTRQTENAPPKGNASGTATMAMMGGMMGMMRGSRMGHMGMANPNEITYDALLANDRTLADPEVVRVAARARVRLRIINAASSSHFWIDLGSLEGRVLAVDGHPVRPVRGQRFPLAIAQRLDILLDLPHAGAFPVLAELGGSARRTGIVLASPGAPIAKLAASASSVVPPVDNSLEVRLTALEPLAPKSPDLVRRMVLSGGMRRFAWSIDGEFWPEITPLMLAAGERVEIELLNHSMMAHPMHLHGHSFQVVAINGRAIAGAVRDTVLVEPMMGSARIAFDANNPGRWAFHCHNLYHMATGMMTEFRYRGVPV